MMLRDEEIKPVLPQPTGDFTGQGPATMEDVFRPQPEPLPTPPPMKVRTADASGKVPLPARGAGGTPDPGMPERAPGGGPNLQGSVKADDSRYQDPQNLIMGNVIMGGMLPWAQAAADVASGRVPMEKFDEVRMEHERRIEELNEQHAGFKSAAEKAVPFLEGLGLSVIKPAKTVVGAMARGAAVTAPQGAAQGFSSGPIEEPSASMNRAGRAVGGAAKNAAIGSAGAAAGKTVGSMLESRALRKAEAAATKKLDDEAVKVSGGRKPLTPEQAKKADADFEARGKQLDEQLTTDWKRYTEMPKGKVSAYWEENRKFFASDPVGAYNKAAESGLGLEAFSHALNLPQAVVVSRLAGKKGLATDTQLFRDGEKFLDVAEGFKARGLHGKQQAQEPAAPAAKQPEAAKAAKPKAEPKPKAAPKPPKEPVPVKVKKQKDFKPNPPKAAEEPAYYFRPKGRKKPEGK